MLLGLAPATASAGPVGSIVSAISDQLTVNQSLVDQVSRRGRHCHWHRKCGWKRVCRWRHGYYRCGYKWRCWSWCHRHYKKRRHSYNSY
jgi:hypothetical protein